MGHLGVILGFVGVACVRSGPYMYISTLYLCAPVHIRAQPQVDFDHKAVRMLSGSVHDVAIANSVIASIAIFIFFVCV